jgi:hypothetical protein
VTDWTTISSLATAGGTLVLAAATFASVRSANRAARSAERALLVGLRPVLFSSRPDDPLQKIRWGDDHWARLRGGGAVLEDRDGVIYMAMSLRNVGSGIAVLRGWRVDRTQVLNPHASIEEMQATMLRPDPAAFRPQNRDLYSPPADTSFWQAAIRSPDDPDRPAVAAAVAGRCPLVVDLLYGDQEGGQRTISRFSITRHPADEDEWSCTVVRHWYLDRQDPR